MKKEQFRSVGFRIIITKHLPRTLGERYKYYDRLRTFEKQEISLSRR